MQFIEDLVFSFCISALVVIAVAAVMRIPVPGLAEADPVEPVEVTCVGHEGCHLQVFDAHQGRKAVCAIYADRQSVCRVEPQEVFQHEEKK